MVQKILAKLFGTHHDREMKKIQPIVDKINSLEESIKKLSDDQLKHKTVEFRERLAKGETVFDILPEAFAVCREASIRTLGMRHYDVQMIGGVVLNRGGIAEMRTGEGKTLVATLPVYLNGLTGKGCHVVSVNDYLVKRDCEEMGRLYNWLGLTTGVIVHGMTDEQRRAAYNADITYCTNNEIGFDYLRDNMKFDLADYVQRKPHFAIVDECDSILIDEARTPLIISGPAEASTDKYYVIDKIIPFLKKDTHFTIEEKSKSASLTEEGNQEVEKLLKLDNLYDPQNIEILHHVNQALRAHHLYRLDVEYMIKDGEIVIVDEFTGRLMPGRRWSDGLHQAIEAKEKVEVKNENQTLATITFQNYFRMYDKLSGMTGTADTEAVEFRKIYNLGVTVIPTNKPIQRMDKEDIVFKTENAKYKAIVNDIRERHAKGQPVLVGTASIEKSEAISRFLKNEGIRHDVLNAKHHEREAEIIALAGRKGAITIATNMAGRGTDIRLGGNPEVLAKKAVGNDDTPEYTDALQRYKAQVDAEKQEVLHAGGLYIVGTERHESRRIDNQLRGRSGRQGDPGESMFYLSLEDNLMRIFNGERIQKIMTMLNIPEDEPIVHKMVTNAIEGAQRKVEGHNFDIRKHLLDYDDVMNQQRHAIYSLRRQILEGKDIERTLLDYMGDVVSNILDSFIPATAKPHEMNFEGLNNALMQQFGFRVNAEGKNSQAVEAEITENIKKIYDMQKKSMGPFFEQISKMILLNAIDQKWKEHLYTIDKVKEGINLRAYGQKDPLIEYKKEAFKAFENLNHIIKTETIEKVMRVQLVGEGLEEAMQRMRPEDQDMEELNYSSPDENAAFQPTNMNAGMEAVSDAPQKRKIVTGPPRNDDRPMNRADRRKKK
ncbi:preprotein translocase subunit SecA [Pseudobdellovibrio sp. HCB154]|uniref:preprotein translocase subunit SecA n=1 Tax=Pseudobdellovibrio sp. HCB154 TaxID=3386277 RepID=UPI0039176681